MTTIEGWGFKMDFLGLRTLTNSECRAWGREGYTALHVTILILMIKNCKSIGTWKNRGVWGKQRDEELYEGA